MTDLKQMIQWHLRGRQDNAARTPWTNAPMTERAWMEAGGRETRTLKAYWDGFNGGVLDAMSKARREVQRG